MKRECFFKKSHSQYIYINTASIPLSTVFFTFVLIRLYFYKLYIFIKFFNIFYEKLFIFPKVYAII